MIYVGTDDGLVQVTEDGGRTWRKIENFPGVADHAYVTDVLASPRDANTVFATFNNYQRGDFKPYVCKSADRGRTWTSIAGNLPQRSGAWSIVQDHVNGDLLFAGLEFGVWFTVDGGQHWTQLKGGHADDAGARPARSSGARTIWSSARSAAGRSSSTTIPRCAT